MSKSSPALILTWEIAAAEASHLQHEFIEPAHLFIGICSLGKFKYAADFGKLQMDDTDIRLAKQHIDLLSRLFSDSGLEFVPLRRSLRYHIETRISKISRRDKQTIHRSTKSRAIFMHAEKLAYDSGIVPTTIFHLLVALLDEASLASWFGEMGINVKMFREVILATIVEVLAVDDGILISQVSSNELGPPEGISEGEFAEIHVRLINIAIQSQGQALLERFVDEVCRLFPQADQTTLLLIEEDGEPVVRAGWPVTNPQVSFTLVNRVILSQTALHWIEGTDEDIESLFDTASALYAPILYGKKVIGVLQVGKRGHADDPFAELDLYRLSVVANTLGLALQAGGTNKLPRYPWAFVSYAHKDRDAVRRLVGDLRRRRIRVWIDEHLSAGEEWRKQLAVAIGHTDTLILVLSPDSVSSEYVLWEVETARSAGKKIIPVYHKTCEIPAQIAALQYIDIRADYEKGIYLLNQTLDNMSIHSHDI